MIHIVVSKKSLYSYKISEHIKKQNVDSRVTLSDELSNEIDNNIPLSNKKMIHYKGGPLAVINKAEQAGYLSVNSYNSLLNTSKKLHSNMLAKSFNIRIAETHEAYLPGDINLLTNVYNILETKNWTECVLKPTLSSGNGKNVWLLNKNFLFQGIIDPSVKNWFIQKRLIYNRLIRCIVLGGVVQRDAVFYDCPIPGDWKCTVCINPNVKLEKNPSDELINFIQNICKNVTLTDKVGVSYIDVYETDDGYVYGETNTSCDLTHHENACKIKLHERIAEYLVSVYNNSN